MDLALRPADALAALALRVTATPTRPDDRDAPHPVAAVVKWQAPRPDLSHL
jgi:hypothetical protein